MRELRIGVIGVGGRGGLAGFAHNPGAGTRLVAGADSNPGALVNFQKQYQPDFVTDDYRQLLARDDVEAVFICTPDFLHEEMAVAALEAGKAVYLEKPLAITIAGCDRILRAARDHQAKLYLGHNMRHMHFVRKLKELVTAGAIGEVKAGWCRHFVGYGGDFYFHDWHADRRNTLGLLLQKGTHDIDVLHWVCGGYARRVVGMGGLTVYGRAQEREAQSPPAERRWTLDTWPPLSIQTLNPVVDVEDVSQVLLELDNGVFCSYQQCHYTPDYWRNYTIIGTEGRLENFGNGEPGTVIRLWNRKTSYNPAGDHEFPALATGTEHGGADPLIVAEFVRYVREGGTVATSPVAARYSVAAGVLATESLRSGSVPKEMPPFDPAVAAYFA